MSSNNSLNSNDKEEIEHFCEQVSMHIVATSPKYLTRNLVPEDVLKGEHEIIKEQLKNNSHKKIDEKNLEKIINAKFNKWCEDNVLAEQTFVIVDHDDENKSSKIEDLVREKGASIGNALFLKDFRLLI